MQQLRQPEAPRDPELYDQRPNPFAAVKIVILRGVDQIETRHPANYAGSQDDRRKIDAPGLRNPGADRSNRQRQA